MFKKMVFSALSVAVFSAVLTSPIQAANTSSSVDGQREHSSVSARWSSEEEWIRKSAAVPAGWVVIREDLGSKLIKNTAGAPYGEELRVSKYSPVPAGWVVLRDEVAGRVIKYVIGASYRTEFNVTKFSPIPTGWVVSRENYDSKTIMNVVGAPYGTVLLVSKYSPVPPGWVYEGQVAAGMYIKNLNR
ncbi:hypothetical protein ABH14_07265 [Brevibacillus brevis]|uniref:hypothetical protein n=1 Tax=Brevibacillus brevis TaxID=1393 RepID=UPI001900D4C5|nr:hypothetical protein [Brevibacillus brevis]MBH0329606.1 hypothetical protein [Brevibacillus brevis]